MRPEHFVLERMLTDGSWAIVADRFYETRADAEDARRAHEKRYPNFAVRIRRVFL